MGRVSVPISMPEVTRTRLGRKAENQKCTPSQIMIEALAVYWLDRGVIDEKEAALMRKNPTRVDERVFSTAKYGRRPE